LKTKNYGCKTILPQKKYGRRKKLYDAAKNFGRRTILETDNFGCKKLRTQKLVSYCQKN
jgi:hypothetical protein